MTVKNVAKAAAEELTEMIYEGYVDEDSNVVGPSEITGSEKDGYSFTMIDRGRVIKVTHQDVTGQVKHVPAGMDQPADMTDEERADLMAKVFPDGFPQVILDHLPRPEGR